MTLEVPVPRTRNAAATRQSILESAWRRFTDEGYDRASLRDIASDAGVDVALVSRYFGSKEELFKAVLNRDGPPDDLLQGDLADFGERVARMFVIDPIQNCKLDKILMILRSASSPKAAEVVRRNGQESFYGPLEAMVGGEDRAIKARLLASVITGLAISRAIDDDYLLPCEDHEKLCTRLAAVLQGIVDQT